MSDAMGRAVLSKMVLGTQITLDSDLSNLSKGIYFINITLPNGERVQQKLLKQ
jgi:hypothetical protein